MNYFSCFSHFWNKKENKEIIKHHFLGYVFLQLKIIKIIDFHNIIVWKIPKVRKQSWFNGEIFEIKKKIMNLTKPCCSAIFSFNTILISQLFLFNYFKIITKQKFLTHVKFKFLIGSNFFFLLRPRPRFSTRKSAAQQKKIFTDASMNMKNWLFQHIIDQSSSLIGWKLTAILVLPFLIIASFILRRKHLIKETIFFNN